MPLPRGIANSGSKPNIGCFWNENRSWRAFRADILNFNISRLLRDGK